MARTHVAISVSAPAELIVELDRLLQENGQTRSGWFTQQVEKALAQRGRYRIVGLDGKTCMLGDKEAVYVTEDRANEVLANVNRGLGREYFRVVKEGPDERTEAAETAGSWNGA